MSFSLNYDLKKIKRSYDEVFEDWVDDFKKDIVEATPVDTGALKKSFDTSEPKEIEPNVWILASSDLPYAWVIDRGRVFENGRFYGSEQLPKGYAPIILNSDRKLRVKLNAI